jgi:hypothetical protein
VQILEASYSRRDDPRCRCRKRRNPDRNLEPTSGRAKPADQPPGSSQARRGSRQNRDFRDAHHRVAAAFALNSNHQIALPWEAAMQQRVSAIMAYVINEGRLCALKPSEWSLLLVGVALCGFLTLLYLITSF